MVRPKAIDLFEKLVIASLVLSLLNIFVFAREAPGLSYFELGGLALTAILTLLVSRKRSNIVRWLLIVLLVLGIVYAVYLVATGAFGGEAFDAKIIVSLIASALQVAGIVQLFRPEANDWLTTRESAAAE